MSNEKSVRFPIKFKLLLFVIIIVTSSVGGFALYATGVLKNEKYLDVYQNSSSKIERFGKDLTDKLDSIINIGYNIESISQVMPKNAQKMINQTNDFIFWGKTNKNKITQFLENKNQNLDIYSGKNKNEIRKKIAELVKGKFTTYSLYKIYEVDDTPLYLFFYKSLDTRSSNFSVIQLSNILSVMKSDNLDNYSLLSNTDDVLFQTNSEVKFQEILAKRKLQSSGSFKELIDEKEYLISYFKNQKFNLNLVSLVNVDKAYTVIYELVSKCFSYAAIILGLSIIISTFISNSLTHPILQLYDGTKAFANRNFLNTIKVKTNDELAHLANSFNDMGGEINTLLKQKQTMIDELEDLNQNLELKVEQRVAELKKAHDFISTMVNSLDQGLFVVNKDGQCHDLYTKACDELFEVSPQSSNLVDVLNLKEDSSTTTQWLTMIFSEMIPFKDAVSLGPAKIERGKDEEFKSIDLKYFPIKNDDNKLENIVCVGTDVTSKVIAEQAYQKSKNYVEKVIWAVSQRQFFLNSIESLTEIIEHLMNDKSVDIVEYKRELHTIKSGAAICSLNHLAFTVNEYETELGENEDLFNSKHEFISILKTILSTEVEEVKEFLGDEYIDKKKRSTLLYEDILTYHSSITDQKVKEDIYKKYVCENLVDYLESYNMTISQVAEQENKLVHKIKFNNDFVPLIIEPFKSMISSLVHIFSNSVAHGIEAPSDREMNNKDSHGQIVVDINQPSKDKLTIKISDDGGGINVDKLREKISNKNLSDNEVLYSIFDDGVTTRDEASSVAGRGVGISATKNEIEKLGGTIKVESILGSGTIFHIELPINS